MPKPKDPPTDRELLEEALEQLGALAAAAGTLFDVEDSVEIHTHSGGIFAGVIEDANINGVTVRTSEDRLFFVGYSGIESSEIFEKPETDDDGQEIDGEGEASTEAEHDITPISSSRVA